jgi:hypothetical protein
VHRAGHSKPDGTAKPSANRIASKSDATPVAFSLHSAVYSRPRADSEQGPGLLYCSDERRMSDLNSKYCIPSYSHDPHGQPIPEVLHDTYSSVALSRKPDSQSASVDVYLVDSAVSRSTYVSSSITILVAMYDSHRYLPPPLPILQ